MRKLIFFSIILLLVTGLYSVRVHDYAFQVTQPDGQVLNCFISGDENYRWLHDSQDYTIIQNEQTGYFVYAQRVGNELIPSPYVFGSANPVTVGLEKNLKHSSGYILQKVASKNYASTRRVREDRTPTSGTINNLVVFIRFSGESEFDDQIMEFNSLFNNNTADANSMRNYFLATSYNMLTVDTGFYPIAITEDVQSYQDSHPRSYYQPYSVSNPTGYQNDAQATQREHTLLRSAIEFIAPQVPTELNLDGDNDGKVDNVCFIIKGNAGAWADLLWPHMSSLESFTVNINGKRVYNYNFQLRDFLIQRGVGVLCHEMQHSLGFPDLYHYSYDNIDPVGDWDIMETDSNPPQFSCAYMKQRYTDWLENIPEIQAPGTFTLNSLMQSTNNSFILESPYTYDELFVIEYRKQVGTFESQIPGTGLLVYRINKMQSGQGNPYGSPDEVYLYRPDGTYYVNGNINNAFFSSESGRTAFNETTNPSPFLSNSNLGGIALANIGSAGETITFDVLFPEPNSPILLYPHNRSENVGNVVSFNRHKVHFAWNSLLDCVCNFTLATDANMTNIVKTINGVEDEFVVDSLSANATYYWKITNTTANSTSPVFRFTVEPNATIPSGTITMEDTSMLSEYYENCWDVWRIMDSNYGGGDAPEMIAFPAACTNAVARLISYPLDLPIRWPYQVNFQTAFMSYDPTAVTIKLQSSPDKVTWYDEWVPNISSGYLPPANVSVNLQNFIPGEGSVCYISWVIEGDFSQLYGWVVDNISFTPVENADEIVAPKEMTCSAYPNPFNPTTTIKLTLPLKSPVDVDIYNIKGQKVSSLFSGDLDKGEHSFTWKGLDNTGKHCGSGVYFYKVKTDSKEIVRKVLMLK